jgi:hypothetical protein
VIGYLDTSAFVSIIIDEPASIAARQFWDDADTVVSSGLIVVETAAALAAAHRVGRLTADGHRRAQHTADRLQLEFDVVAPDKGLVGRLPNWRGPSCSVATTLSTARPPSRLASTTSSRPQGIVNSSRLGLRWAL